MHSVRDDGRLVLGGLRDGDGDPAGAAGGDDTAAGDPTTAAALRLWFSTRFPEVAASGTCARVVLGWY